MRPSVCKHCRFWVPAYKRMTIGQCRRFPPSVPDEFDIDLEEKLVKESDYATGVWPRTIDDDWCGEFQPREESEQ